MRLVPLQPDASAMAQAVAKTAAPSGDAAKQPRSAPHSAAVPMLRAQSTFAGAPPDNKPVVETIGQGLSKKLQADADVAVASALQACEASGGKFEDGSFPPTEASLAPQQLRSVLPHGGGPTRSSPRSGRAAPCSPRPRAWAYSWARCRTSGS